MEGKIKKINLFNDKMGETGNAVMPKFMEAIANHIKKEIFEKL